MDQPVAQAADSAAQPAPKPRENVGGLRRCYLCKRELPLDRFLTITERQTRPSGKMYTYRGPSYDCRDCRNEAKREGRRRAAEHAGRPFMDRAAREAAAAERRAAKEAERQAHLDKRQRVRRYRQQSSELRCNQCHVTKPRADFMPSDLTGRAPPVCRACSCAASHSTHRAQSEALADPYVKRLIANKSGLGHAEIPPALIEAKRVQLQIFRALPKTPRARRRPAEPSGPARYAEWLAGMLAVGPIDAVRLNALARAAGFKPQKDYYRSARRRVAVYDQKRNTWSQR
jgi:hypothetical protein